MIGLTSLEVYNFIFNKTEEIIEFELYRENFDEFSFAEPKNVVEEIINDSDISPEDLRDDTKGPSIISVCRKLQMEKSSTDGSIILLADCAASPCQKFESYLTNTGDLKGDDIQLILKHYIPKVVRYEIPPGI